MLHVRRPRNAIDLVHLLIPGGAAGLMVRPGRLEQLERGARSGVVKPLRVVVSNGIAERRYVRDGEHFVSSERRTQDHPESARVHRIVESGLEVAEPPGLRHRPALAFRDRVRLNEALDLLLEDRIILEPVQLNRVESWHHRRRRRGRIQSQRVHVRVLVYLARVDQEEELTANIIRVIEHQRVLLNEAPLVAKTR